MPNTEHASHETPNLAAERRIQLEQLFPEAFSEGKVDFDKLRAALGDLADDRRERYSFTWAGKQDAILSLQTPSRATLKPARDESIDFDTTQNVFIEGENLEVLKLLYKSYFGRVKLIYIDPPYNTGNDFIYPDNYADPLDTYLRLTGQKDGNGNLLTSNPETNGRYHSVWLTMMYPRLFIARQCLREDGIIMVSIDDHEIHNLRAILNEVFGEENFIAQLVWEKGRKNDARLFSVGHEYILIYAHSLAALKALGTIWREPKPGAREIWEKYAALREKYGDDNVAIEKALQDWYKQLTSKHPSKALSRYKHVDKYGPWRDRDISWPGGGGPRYDVIHPITGKPCKVPERGWGFATSEAMQRQIELGLVEFRDNESEPPFRKAHLYPIPNELLEDDEATFDEDEQEATEVGLQVMPSVLYKQSQVAVKYLRTLMGAKVFDNPKDHEVLARLIRYCTNDNDLVMDFFAGSCATAEAVLQLNHDEFSNRRFVMVQLPEPTLKKKKDGTYEMTAAYQAGYSTIAEIGKERIRRVIDRMKADSTSKLDLSGRAAPEDLGFKVFNLTESNYKHWPDLAPDTDPEEYSRQMALFADPLKDDWLPEDVIYEVAIKEGFSFTCRVEQVQEVTGATVYQVIDDDRGQFFTICLDKTLTLDSLKPLGLQRDNLFICRSIALDDTASANLALQCRLKTI